MLRLFNNWWQRLPANSDRRVLATVALASFLAGLLLAYGLQGSERFSPLFGGALGAAIGASITVGAADRRARDERAAARQQRLEKAAIDLHSITVALSLMNEDIARKTFQDAARNALFDLQEILEERREILG
jgi:hypothetical protein